MQFPGQRQGVAPMVGILRQMLFPAAKPAQYHGRAILAIKWLRGIEIKAAVSLIFPAGLEFHVGDIKSVSYTHLDVYKRQEQAIMKMTSLPADRMKLEGRGRLAEGCFAAVSYTHLLVMIIHNNLLHI